LEDSKRRVSQVHDCDYSEYREERRKKSRPKKPLIGAGATQNMEAGGKHIRGGKTKGGSVEGTTPVVPGTFTGHECVRLSGPKQVERTMTQGKYFTNHRGSG